MTDSINYRNTHKSKRQRITALRSSVGNQCNLLLCMHNTLYTTLFQRVNLNAHQFTLKCTESIDEARRCISNCVVPHPELHPASVQLRSSLHRSHRPTPSHVDCASLAARLIFAFWRGLNECLGDMNERRLEFGFIPRKKTDGFHWRATELKVAHLEIIIRLMTR